MASNQKASKGIADTFDHAKKGIELIPCSLFVGRGKQGTLFVGRDNLLGARTRSVGRGNQGVRIIARDNR